MNHSFFPNDSSAARPKRQGFGGATATTAALVAILASARPAQAHLCYVPFAAVRLRADSLRTGRRLETIVAGDELTPLGAHSDLTGMYRVVTAEGDTGWVAAEYLLESTDVPTHRIRLSALRAG